MGFRATGLGTCLVARLYGFRFRVYRALHSHNSDGPGEVYQALVGMKQSEAARACTAVGFGFQDILNELCSHSPTRKGIQ